MLIPLSPLPRNTVMLWGFKGGCFILLCTRQALCLGWFRQLWGVQGCSRTHPTRRGRPPAPCSIFGCSRVGIAPPALAAFTSAPGAAVTLAWSQLRELGALWFIFRVNPYPEQSHPAPTVPVLLLLGWNNPPAAAGGYFGLQPPCPPCRRCDETLIFCRSLWVSPL